jgi:hypothetical protein
MSSFDYVLSVHLRRGDKELKFNVKDVAVSLQHSVQGSHYYPRGRKRQAVTAVSQSKCSK